MTDRASIIEKDRGIRRIAHLTLAEIVGLAMLPPAAFEAARAPAEKPAAGRIACPTTDVFRIWDIAIPNLIGQMFTA
jgi:hypothetical protein